MNLSPHFTLEEFVRSDTAARLEIANTPSDPERVKLAWLADQLEPVRVLLGALHVNSAFRCLELNRALKSKDDSQHVRCEAADLSSLVGLTPHEMCQRVMLSHILFDQLIYEFESWMHISFAYGRKPRGNVITINRDGTFQGLVDREAA